MDKFVALNEDSRRQYVARALACNPDAPAGWPNRLIDDLIAIRLNEGPKRFYEALGTVLAPQ